MASWEELRGDSTIDSREIIDRIDELQEIENPTPDTEQELDLLVNFAETCATYMDDWNYGETLILDSYFEEYAEQLAEAISPDTKWPLNFIDWGAAAEALKEDYTEFKIDGLTYWGR